MKFCPKCGNLMIAEKRKGKLVYVCRKCGYILHQSAKSTSITEEIKPKEERIPVFKKDDAFKQYPKTKIICPKCGNNEAYWFMQQTRGGDEPPTRFYRCTKCGYIWREY